jgi:NCAIR mutase (PurE)-related protein
VVENFPHGQLLVAGWQSIEPAVQVRRLAAEHGLYVETFLGAVYPMGDGRVVVIAPLDDVALPDLRAADCVVVAAGQDAALASVVGGLVATPVIAVPTSVGYGVAAGGQVALLSMLCSCAPGVAIVNIDDGFGAATVASRIARAAAS